MNDDRAAGDLAGVFKAPRWLRDIGLMAWLVVGVGVVLVGAVWVLSLTQVIVAPVIAATVVAAVASPVVARLERHRVPRVVSAVLLLLALVCLTVLVTVVVLAGITGEASDVKKQLADAKQAIQGWLKDLGVDPGKAKSATKDASSSSTEGVSALLHGVGAGAKELSSLVFFLALTALSTLFLLKDGPTIRAWVEGHMGVPAPLARIVSRRSLQSLRGYFFGVTLVAAFNAVVVLAGALILGVPLAGTVAAVTFLAAYVPYIGAWTAGIFAVLIALGGAGADAAAGMVVVQLLANSVLQQLVQPFAMGSALGIHPLAVLIVTLAGGALFGAAGLILAAPVTATVVRVAGDLSGAEPDPTAASP